MGHSEPKLKLPVKEAGGSRAKRCLAHAFWHVGRVPEAASSLLSLKYQLAGLWEVIFWRP